MRAFLIARATFRESIRNRWIVFFSIAFAGLALLLPLVGTSELSMFSSFDRSSVMLLNILMIFVPLLGFTLGAQMIAGDRETGTLVYLLSHPMSKRQLFFGKFLGVVWALALSLTAGFGVAAFGMAASGAGEILSFVVLWLMSLLFIVICVAMGMLVSVLSDNRGQAMGTAVMGWLIFTVFSDLGLMGTAFMLRLRSEGVVGLTLLNPVEVFKITVVRLLASNLEVLGAGGMYLDITFGRWLPILLVGWLAAITLGCLAGAYWIFKQQEEF